MASNAIILAFQPTGLQPTGSRTHEGRNNIAPFHRRPQGVNPNPGVPPPPLPSSAVNYPIPPHGGLVPPGSLAIPTNQASSPYWAPNAVRLDNGATHQYSISAQLHVIDPTVDTLEVGHHIINGQPLVLYFRVVKGSDGKTSYELLDAGYAKK